jgi:transmembrane sensor
VAEGKVAIEPQIASAKVSGTSIPTMMNMTSGEFAQFMGGSTVAIRQLERKELARKISWTDGLLVFEGETLEKATEEFNRYNRRQLVITDPKLARIQIGGTFQPRDLDSFVASLERSFDVQAVSDGPKGEGQTVRLQWRKQAPDTLP